MQYLFLVYFMHWGLVTNVMNNPVPEVQIKKETRGLAFPVSVCEESTTLSIFVDRFLSTKMPENTTTP